MGDGHRILEKQGIFFFSLQIIGSPIHFLFQECNEFTYKFAEEIRRQSFGAVTPGYDFMARLRYIHVYRTFPPKHMSVGDALYKLWHAQLSFLPSKIFTRRSIIQGE